MELGAYIRRRRQTTGFSLRKLAEMIRVNPAYLSRVERGIVPLSDTLIRAVAEALGTEAEELLLLAGRLPANWKQAIAASPARTIETLRTALASCVSEPMTPYGRTVLAFGGTRAIEDPSFPFEHLSDIAELESWRKEINRPVYHIHKWWAQRLGSVFRAVLLGSFAPKGSNILEMFYQPARLPGAVIFDPFMGSGTTVGEALKLGARAIGRDINPVAYFIVRNALDVHQRWKVVETFRAIERDIAAAIRRFYQARLPAGGMADVLYYFWVKVVSCPRCWQPVDLFSSYIFAQHAYPTRYPEARALCPHCGAINTLRYDTEQANCSVCHELFKPKAGPLRGAKATCPGCGHTFLIAKTVQEKGEPPAHRLYAKMVLQPNGLKEYLPADDYDLALYNEASSLLRQRKNAYPVVPIEPGYNTNQVLNYCYTHWHQMFNDRQLLCLSLLAERIQAIPDERLRDLFACLFSGTLEFNNMFASFKGEGTGAVRHMFSHHILKPERTPLEANLWGTPKSSGAFSTLFESRLLRALSYCENPFEVRVVRKNGKITTEKVYGLSCSLGHDVAETFAEFQEGRHLYLSCGDSSKTDLVPESVDAVVTDPPFFDNVHYSQLADFFYVWQCYVLGANGHHNAHSTRSLAEVQQSDPVVFTERLSRVWAECHRVLRPGGLLVFTYHHSRVEGWRCILEAIVKAEFCIVAAHPIKAEMSVAAPKHQAKEPIDLDVILICRKRETIPQDSPHSATLIDNATQEAASQVARLNSSGRFLSRNDVRVVLMAQIIKRLSWQPSLAESLRYLDSSYASVESAINRLYQRQQIVERPLRDQTSQLTLW
ncbi:MAG: helix-turn-helix domain-containing protein [Candidatus Tectomicrobia bacterium]|nr:helix-turn-helix domain-containing protein [Candidatus Tectomicrobia bacterium]